MSGRVYGAIEAGGSKFVCAAGHGATEFIERFQVSIPTSTPVATLAAVVAFFARVQYELGPLAAIGIAAFGPVDLNQGSPGWGCLLETPKVGWSSTSLISPLKRFGCPIAIDTDVNAAALAERELGAGADSDLLVYVTVGSGIGGRVVIGRRTVRRLLHPEMGHIRVQRDPRDQTFEGICPFHRDCLEGLACGPAIMKRWNAPVNAWPVDHPGLEIIGGYLGQLAASIALLVSAERILMGGGAMNDGRLLPYVRAAARTFLNGYLPIEERAGGFDRFISAPALGARAGIVGAMLLACRAVRDCTD